MSLRERKPAPLPEIVCQRVQQVAGRARQAVEARDGEHVALGKLVESAAQSGAAGLRAAGLLAVDFGRATVGAERRASARRC